MCDGSARALRVLSNYIVQWQTWRANGPISAKNVYACVRISAS